MRRFIALLALIAFPALAADPLPVEGLWLLTDYPSQTVRPGETANVRFKLQNAGLSPEQLALSVSGVPTDWKIDILGGGQPVALGAQDRIDLGHLLESRLAGDLFARLALLGEEDRAVVVEPSWPLLD